MHRHPHERGRLAKIGRATDDGDHTTLLLVHGMDGSWTFHGLGAPGVTLSEPDTVALAQSIPGACAVSGDRAVLVVNGADGFAIHLTDGPGAVEPDPERAALPAGMSHLLAADDALIPGRWGAHITLCGLAVRRPGVNATEDDYPDRYCPACVAEAGRWVAEPGDRAGGCQPM